MSKNGLRDFSLKRSSHAKHLMVFPVLESMLTIETFSDFDNNYRLRNLTLIGLGCFGGLMGMLAYFSMNKNKPQNNTE